MVGLKRYCADEGMGAPDGCLGNVDGVSFEVTL